MLGAIQAGRRPVMPSVKDRCRGMLLGTAVGDAVGLHLKAFLVHAQERYSRVLGGIASCLGAA